MPITCLPNGPWSGPKWRWTSSPFGGVKNTYSPFSGDLFARTKNAQLGRLSLALIMNEWLSCHALSEL